MIKNIAILILLIASFKTVAGDKKQIKCLADNIYHEARGEGDNGMLAVGNVTMNRVKSKHYPNTICGVVWQYKQFSWTLNKPKINDIKSYKKSLKIANKAITGNDITNGALFFHTKDRIPYWAKSKKFIKRIKNHLFYR